MAGVYKRDEDKKRGLSGKWTMWWYAADGSQRSEVGTTDKRQSLEIAQSRETEARLIKEGLVDPGDRKRREASLRPVADHVDDYRLDLIAKGGTHKHANQIASALLRLLSSADVKSVAEMSVDQIQAALSRMTAKGRSARTVNHARAAIKAFGTWLEDSKRIKESPKFKTLSILPEESDRKRVRRALTVEESIRLLDATLKGEPVTTRRNTRANRKITATMTGADREVCYRVALSTGFRLTELSSLTPESFKLDGDDPSIILQATNSKRGKKSGLDDKQQIRRDVAESLKEWLATREPGKPVFPLPSTAAQMLAADLIAAGIDPVDPQGRVLDFHAFRHTYITQLVKDGVNIKLVQRLARHSTITLTLDRYTSVEDDDVRGALEGGGK